MAGVSTEVWQRLDPLAGRLSRRSVWRLRLGIVVACTASVVASLLWVSGTLYPRVVWFDDGGMSWMLGPDMVGHEVIVTNDGWSTVRVVGVGRSGPGLELVVVHEGSAGQPDPQPFRFPHDLARGEVIHMTFYSGRDPYAIEWQRGITEERCL